MPEYEGWVGRPKDRDQDKQITIIAQKQQTGCGQLFSLMWGIAAIIGMLIGFMPFFGALNWLNIPFAGVGIIVSALALATSGSSPKGASIAGLLCCMAAFFFGFIRLIMGGGMF